MAAPSKPLPAKTQRFITYYCMPRCRDLKKAAELAGHKPAYGVTLYAKPEVRAEIDRRLEVIDSESARLMAEQEVEQATKEIEEDHLEESFLDKRLRGVIELEPKEHGRTVLAALQLGYVLKNKIQAGNTQAIAPPPAAQVAPSAPGFYRAFETTTTHREVTVPSPSLPPSGAQPELPPPSPPIIDVTPDESEPEVYSY